MTDEGDPERSWRREKALAAATRRRLVLDVLAGLLPYEVSRTAQTRIVLLRAVRAAGGRPDAHPGQVFEALRRDASEHHEHAVVVADFLDEMRRLSRCVPSTGIWRAPAWTSTPGTGWPRSAGRFVPTRSART